MSNLSRLIDYFPAGATEGERHILSRVFVYWETYAALLTPPPTSPRLLIGKKGSGKTAIIDYYSSVLSEAGLPVLVVRPMDIDVSAFQEGAALGESTRVALAALSRAIAQRLGSTLGGLLDERSTLLYRAAVEEGARDADIVDKLAELLPRIAKPFIGIDLSELRKAGKAASVKALIEAIEENTKKSGRTLHLFIDDTDQLAAPDKPGHLQRIWAFLLAARELTQKVPQLRCVITIRDEVWRRLLRDAAGQRDQADHFLPLARELFPTRDHIWAVVERRLAAAAEDIAETGKNHLAPFFEGDGANMPYTQEFRSWRDLIIVRSRERPRDAIQLIHALALGAMARGRDRIVDSDVQIEMPKFSESRVALLKHEVEDECPEIVEVVGYLANLDFDAGSFKSTTETVRQTIGKIASSFGVMLRGQRLQPNHEGDALLLWSYLYELGVLNARVPDDRMKDKYRHVVPQEDPSLVSKPRWNEMQQIIWEVNPVYRDYLIRLQGDAAARVGAVKVGRKKPKRRR